MRDLAETLGIEAASLYNHVGSKEEILQEICFRMADEFFTSIESAIQAVEGPSERLHAAIGAHLRVIAANSDASGVFLHEWRHMREPFLKDFRHMRRRYEGIFRELIEEGISAGVFKNVDPNIAARTLLSATNWTYESYRPNTKFSSDQVAELITTILIEGITI